jgi:hypothetical protein
VYINDNGNACMEDDDQCIDCRHIMKHKVRCPLVLMLSSDIVFIREDGEYDGTLIVRDCPMYFKKNLRLVKDGTQGI